MEVKEFLRQIWGDQTGWAFLGYGTNHENFREMAYQYPEDLDKYVLEATRQNTWANVYFCTHLCTERRRNKQTAVGKIHALWMDHDAGYPEMIEPQPTICWQTSPGRFQAAWILSNPIAPHEAEQLNKYLCKKHKADSKWHLASYLRIPTTINHKYDNPIMGTYLWTDGAIFEVDTIRNMQSDEPVEVDMSYTEGIPNDLPSYAEVMAKYGRYIPQSVWRLLETPPQEGDDWSENLWKLERLLLETRIPPEHVFIIVRDSPWNKYKRDNRPEEHLWIEIHKAHAEKPPTDDTGLRWMAMPQLLTYSERPTWLVQDIWIDHTVGFAAGVGKSYKSTLTMDLALSIASGTPFLGRFEIVNPGPVLVVQEEDPIWRVAHRMQVMAEAKGLAGMKANSDIDSFRLEINPLPEIPIYVSVGSGFTFTDKEKCDALEAMIDRHRPRIVFLDPLFMLNPGVDEYKSSDIVVALNTMKYWRNKYGCAICVVHHFRKGEGAANERLYGSMALYAWSENNLWFQRGSGNIVTVTRDIKDASRDLPKIGVEVHDFEDTYRISVEAAGDAPLSGFSLEFAKVRQYLQAYPVNSLVARTEIDLNTGITRKTTTAIIQKLAELGMVQIMRGTGRGAPINIYTLEGLHEDIPDLEVRV